MFTVTSSDTVGMDSFQHLPILAVGLGKVRLFVPMAVQEGDTAVLRCLFDLGGDALYSVKWYKGGREIFRYLPRETPSIKIFPIPYLIDLNIEKEKSNATHLVLNKVTTNLSGRYSCEVSADAPSFRTALVTGDMKIVVPPTTLPRVEGMKPRYRVGDTLKATCTSKNSKPAANLTWGLNGNILDSEYIKKISVKIEPETNLETATSTLSMELQRHHFSASGRLKLKCTASIHNIYWRTSENSAEEERPKAAVVAAQDYRLHDVFRKPIDLFYTTPVPSNCAASIKFYILSISGLSNYLIKNGIFLCLFLFNYCYLY
ncbi:cell adhesion molecule 2-like isoform X2 [Rhodnius prolixus]|uniref:cell adhesion molecule 2-like isoform X2 n=1 Tax=Rhodnius prolixus TaxID=13249 RepID=UPI003D18AC80